MAIDRRREAAGGVPGRLPPAAEENGALPPGDAAASAPLGGRAGPGGGGDIQPLPAPHAAGGPHPSLLLLDYDGSVLPFLGGLGGGYQKTLVLLTWIPALFIGFSQFSDSFLLDQPNFWCREDGKGAEPAGVTATARGGGGDLANWTSPPTTPFSTAAWGTAGPLGNGSGAEGGDAPPLPSPPDKGDNASNCDCHAWDYGLRTGLVQNVVSKWDLVCDNAWKVHVAKFSLLVGLIFGYLITGCIADWSGRRPVLLFSVIFILVFGLTVALSVNVTMFSTLRFFEGFCLAGVILTLYALRSSFWHFPHPPCDGRSKCLHGCLFCPITAALAPLWGWGVSRAGAAAVCSQRTKEHRLRLPSFFWADKAAENKRRVESSG
ncbi:solute carrier family 22 member 23 isoform X3 [Delphinus delphis]|uniref:solute carrier family 22 member 23 isoform X3 n=1 Tax=Delphinus delphis TaxID=9728 RepID=UPI0028C37CBA|nr:solute carrier family 22 member 23 isoform X3 [Delphinus delphis]